ncbi:hypothetical protein [Streptomyces cyaneofuscatus]|uniref:hypothetical protein n=1 Tax=Streptomyces cyaneofuscatus TaxID=66883 RepID=UPI0036DA8E81
MTENTRRPRRPAPATSTGHTASRPTSDPFTDLGPSGSSTGGSSSDSSSSGCDSSSSSSCGGE